MTVTGNNNLEITVPEKTVDIGKKCRRPDPINFSTQPSADRDGQPTSCLLIHTSIDAMQCPMTLRPREDDLQDPLLIYGPVDDAATLTNPNEVIPCLVKAKIEPSPAWLRYTARRAKADAPRTFQVPKSDGDDLSVTFLPGAELSSLIDDAMEHEEHDTEEEEISEEEDLPQGRGPLSLDELDLPFVR
jgi:hypothetical protein